MKKKTEDLGRCDPRIDVLARRHAEDAVRALASVMNDREASHASRVSAAGALLQWGFGRAVAARIGLDEAGEKQAVEQIIRLSWSDKG